MPLCAGLRVNADFLCSFSGSVQALLYINSLLDTQVPSYLPTLCGKISPRLCNPIEFPSSTRPNPQERKDLCPFEPTIRLPRPILFYRLLHKTQAQQKNCKPPVLIILYRL